ncbi:hypothetical protein HPULCUR_006559 [Helicostylum pulchrum]|uniref:Geranylgeranyl diphosphate synthase n=1 Tax=Helicostylum pulchrum TaxID=562976 RepID=A0ABP9Y2A3_9FUNG
MLSMNENREDTRTSDEIILEPYTYLLSHPGKDIRTKLISAFNLWLNVPKDILDVINKAIGMLHNASLMIDDVQDDSELRRGFPVSHHIYGVPQTINTANLVYFLAIQDILRLGIPGMVEICTEELIHLHQGQGIELYWRDSLTCPTEAEYLEMVNNSKCLKRSDRLRWSFNIVVLVETGGLLRLAVRLMQAASESDV